MTQLTIRGFDPRLASEIRKLAKAERISLNRAALRLLARGAGLADRAPAGRTIGDSLDSLIGTWSAAEARKFAGSIRSLEQIDRALWK